MDKIEFEQLDHKAQLDYINTRLTTGISFTQATEKELGLRRNTIRDRFKRMGYVLNQTTMQFESTGEVLEESNAPQPKKEVKAKTEHKKNAPSLEERVKLLEERLALLESQLNLESTPTIAPTDEPTVPATEENKLQIEIEKHGSYRSYKFYPSIIDDLEVLSKRYPHLNTATIVNSLLRESLNRHL